MKDLTLDLIEVAKLLHISYHTARRLAHSEPDRLPPRLRTGGRRVLFLRTDVEEWLKKAAHYKTEKSL